MEPLQSQSRLDIMMGSMFSGKTTALLRKLTQLSELGLSAIYINHSSDNRSTTAFSTHSPLLKDSELKLKTLSLAKFTTDVIQECKTYDIIGIDEAQFFGEDLLDFVLAMVDTCRKYVIVVGLDGNYRREKFGHVLDLIPVATNVTKLHAYCRRCAINSKALRTAIFTHYSGQSSDTVIVGGAEKYQPVCRECYLELSLQN